MINHPHSPALSSPLGSVDRHAPIGEARGAFIRKIAYGALAGALITGGIVLWLLFVFFHPFVASAGVAGTVVLGSAVGRLFRRQGMFGPESGLEDDF